MRQIIKGSCQALIQWRREQTSSPQNITYDDCPIKEEMLLDLLKEQGYLCAYTMQRITVNDSHIEHIKPRGYTREQERLLKDNENLVLPKYQDLELDWHNLVATYPKNGHCEYGEKQKCNYDPENGFVSPINLNVSCYFKFNKTGEIKSKNQIAQQTIDILNLNHEILKNNRKEKITEAISNAKKMTTRSIEIRIQNLRTSSPSNELEEYCEAVAQCLEKVLKQKKAIQQSKIKKKNRKSLFR